MVLISRFNNWVASKLPGWKTKLWAGFLMALGGILTVLEPFQLMDIRAYVQDWWTGYVMLGIGVVTYWLRTVTAREVVKSVPVV